MTTYCIYIRPLYMPQETTTVLDNKLETTTESPNTSTEEALEQASMTTTHASSITDATTVAQDESPKNSWSDDDPTTEADSSTTSTPLTTKTTTTTADQLSFSSSSLPASRTSTTVTPLLAHLLASPSLIEPTAEVHVQNDLGPARLPEFRFIDTRSSFVVGRAPEEHPSHKNGPNVLQILKNLRASTFVQLVTSTGLDAALESSGNACKHELISN